MVLVMDSVWNNECSSRPQKLHLEGTLGSSESSNDFNPRFEPEINTGESFSSDRSSKNSEFDIFAPYKSFRAPQSSVSSSSAASSDDLFEVIPISGIKPHTIVHSTGVLDIQSQTSSNNQVSSDSSAKSDDTEIGSSSEPAPASTASNIVYEPRLHTLSPTQSPPVQNMDRSGEFEPYRIPSSVFARNKSLSPADWSIASNDSLFSIQLGDNSFSRDHVITWGDDLPRSSERLKSSEFIQFGPQPSEAAALPQVTDDDRNDVEKTFKAKQQHVQFVQENDVGQIMEMAAKNTARPVNSSRNSDGSGTSGHSFSFPVLVLLPLFVRLEFSLCFTNNLTGQNVFSAD
ncbi:hypothetical protein SAY86_024012 [Trapa natans]|uniref:Uncharacterized protein n=1 Tax=Trapa natans TaxID=22666 RepID=A0AAN7R8F3_TRANT|nr:hypothetical protein SAY86_024012 [Trapa natans]